MIPYILAAVGGYLIGDSIKGNQYANGGYIDKSNLTSEKPIKAVAWIVTEVNGEPKVMQFSSLQEAKEAKYNLQSTYGKLRIITSVDELKKELLPYDIDNIAHYVYYFPAKQPAMGAPKGWLADGGMMAKGGKTKMNIFKINTSAWEEEDFLLVTDLTRKEVSNVIKDMVKEERKMGSDFIYSNENYISRLKQTYPDNLIISKEPDELNF